MVSAKKHDGIIKRYHHILETSHMKRLLSSGGEFHVASEYRAISDIKALASVGHRFFAEKYCQEMLAKWNSPDLFYNNPFITFFGHLQSNKLRKIISISHSIEGIGSLETARKIANLNIELGLRPRLLIQINTSREPQKNGCLPEHAPDLLDQIRYEVGLSIDGIMLIPKKSSNPVSDFRWARQFADKYQLAHCAMGMSNDYKIAIDCGATIVRIGRLIWDD